MQEVAYLSALIAGILSFVSPCVLPLVPPYMCYMTGSSIAHLSKLDKENTADRKLQTRLLLNSILFVSGFSSVFIALGAGASSISQVLRTHTDTLSIMAGAVIITMGLHFLGIFRIGFLDREARLQLSATGYIGSYVMGLAFAFGWTPCIGPTLGAILGIAATLNTVAKGALLLAVYSAGLGIPFILSALFFKPFLIWMAKFKTSLGTMEKITGTLLVLTGMLFVTGGIQTISWYFLEVFPWLAGFG